MANTTGYGYLLGPAPQFFDANGKPLVGGKLFVYIAGTTTTAVTYSDFYQTENTSPVVLNDLGTCMLIVPSANLYKIVLYDRKGNLLITRDNVRVSSEQQIIYSSDSTVDVTATTDTDTGIVTYDLSIKGEIDRATEAEKGLADSIEAEKKRAEDAESALSESIADKAGTASPLMDGKASVGNSLKYAREDHVHPSDTSREDIANKTTVVLGTSDSKYPTDKAVAEFVNSSIATNTANYISNNGEPFTSVEQLEAYSGPVTNNDYAFVTGIDSEGNTYYDRYKATVSGSTVTWALEYRLNNSSFTAAQWAAINSGVTSDKANYWDGKEDAFNILPTTKGGTGTNAASKSALTSTLINSLSSETSTPKDNDYYVSQHEGGGTSNTTYVRRPVSALWNYIKEKISSVLGLTESNYSGKAATAGTADKAVADKSGNDIETTYAKKTETEEAISNSVDQTYSSTSTKAQSGVAVNEAFKTRETSDSDDSYTYLGMNNTTTGTEKLYWRLVSFKPVSNYWTLQFEMDVSNGRKGNRSFDSNIYETKRLTIYGDSVNAVKDAIELRYAAPLSGNSRGYGNNIYYKMDASNLVTVYINALNSADTCQICKLTSVINLNGISDITWHEPANDAGVQPSKPVRFKANYPAIASPASYIGSDYIPVYINRGRPMVCNPKNLRAGKDDDGNAFKTTYQKKLTFDTTPTAGSNNPVTSGGVKTAIDSVDAKGIVINEINGENVICFE